MLNKRICILLVVLLCCIFAENVFATPAIDGVQGFGGFIISEDPATGDLTVIVSGDGATINTDRTQWIGLFDQLFAKYGKTITWATGVATITLVGVFIWLCVKSAFVASEHWILKRQTMMAMLWVGVGTALMGSTTLILLIFQNAFI